MSQDTKYNDRLIKLGLNVSYYRRYKNITQQQLAENIGMSRDSIAKLEAPDVHAGTSLKALFKIADHLGVPPSKLLEFRDE